MLLIKNMLPVRADHNDHQTEDDVCLRWSTKIALRCFVMEIMMMAMVMMIWVYIYVDEEEVEEIKAKHQGGSAAFPRTDSTHSESTCFLFPCKIHFCYSVFLLIFAIEFKSTDFFYFC